VSDRLIAAGQRVFCPTLTGLGERAHLLSRQVNLDTHIQDVVALLEAEELKDVVLVGHSYGGMVITGVAARAKPCLRQLVYLDAVILEDGGTFSDILPPEVAAARRKAAESSGRVSFPVPDANVFGLVEPADIGWVQRRMTPQPYGSFDQPIRWGGPIGNGIPKVYVDCTDPAYAGLAAMKDRYRGKPDWPFVELRTGHDAMVSAPEETARLLLKYS
jgi:pimeloyl-ACP methyl ester carboxylesterase